MNWKEIRDWTTCLVSVAAPLMIGYGASLMKNQRLEMEAAMSKAYVQREEYSTEVRKLENQDGETWRKLGETNGKIDSLGLQMAASTQLLIDLKEEVKTLRH